MLSWLEYSWYATLFLNARLRDEIMIRDRLIVVRSNSVDEQREHFISRLYERYNISINKDEYESLCNPHGVFHGAFSKQGRKTIGWLLINGTKVWVLRDGGSNMLSTCYPPIVEHDDMEMIRSCFGGITRLVALQLYEIYAKEWEKITKMQFESIKDAAVYFFSKTYFPPLHIEKYKNGFVRTVRVANMIAKILYGESPHVTIALKRKKATAKGAVLEKTTL